MSGILSNIRVLDLSRVLSGPWAGQMLGDFGADVIKVERPGSGDDLRDQGSRLKDLAGKETGERSTFLSTNRAKRSITIDLTKPEGQALVRQLAAQCDVLIENFKTGDLKRYGLDYASLREVNPRLVYCSITGFGASGPDADRPGYDTLGQATSGLLSQLTDLDHPEPMGISLADHLAGLFAAYGVLGALMAREQTGLGQRVDTSLLQASIGVVAENLTRYLASGEVLTRESRVRTAQVFAFTDRDGAPFVIHLSSPDKFWLALLDAVGRSDLAGDPRFATRAARQANREAVQALLDGIFAQGTRDEWLARLQAHDVPCGPLSTLDEVAAAPQVQHLGMVQEVVHPAAGPLRIVKAGVSLGATPLRLGAAPLLDEHREAILGELNLPPDYLADSGTASR